MSTPFSGVGLFPPTVPEPQSDITGREVAALPPGRQPPIEDHLQPFIAGASDEELAAIASQDLSGLSDERLADLAGRLQSTVEQQQRLTEGLGQADSFDPQTRSPLGLAQFAEDFSTGSPTAGRFVGSAIMAGTSAAQGLAGLSRNVGLRTGLPAFEPLGREVEDLANGIDAWTRDHFINPSDAGIVSELIGTTGSVLPGLALTVLGTPLAGGLFVGAQIGGEAYADARARGLSVEDSFTNLLAGAGVGGVTQFGLGRVLTKLDKASGGHMNRLLSTGVTSLGEGLQEMTEQLGLNAIAIHTGDAERELTDELGFSFAAGGTAGVMLSVAQMMASLLPGRTRVRRAGTVSTVTDEELTPRQAEIRDNLEAVLMHEMNVNLEALEVEKRIASDPVLGVVDDALPGADRQTLRSLVAAGIISNSQDPQTLRDSLIKAGFPPFETQQRREVLRVGPHPGPYSRRQQVSATGRPLRPNEVNVNSVEVPDGSLAQQFPRPAVVPMQERQVGLPLGGDAVVASGEPLHFDDTIPATSLDEAIARDPLGRRGNHRPWVTNVQNFTNPDTSPLTTTGYVILSAERGQDLSPEQNQQRTNQLFNSLRQAGLRPIPAQASFGEKEVSFIVPSMSEVEGLAFAERFNQDSIFTPRGVVGLDGQVQAASLRSTKFAVEDLANPDWQTALDEKISDYYTDVRIDNKVVRFSTPIADEKVNFDLTDYSVAPGEAAIPTQPGQTARSLDQFFQERESRARRTISDLFDVEKSGQNRLFEGVTGTIAAGTRLFNSVAAIGAAKIWRGARGMGEYMDAMVQEFGPNVIPVSEKLYAKSKKELETFVSKSSRVPAIDELVAKYKAGRDKGGYEWYQETHDLTTQLFGEDADLMFDFLAIFSLENTVVENAKLALAAMTAHKLGEPIAKSNKRFKGLKAPGVTFVKAQQAVLGEDWRGPSGSPKLWAFKQAMQNPNDPAVVVIDRRISYAFGREAQAGRGVGARGFMRGVIRDIAADEEVLPLQVQAGIWVMQKPLRGDPDAAGGRVTNRSLGSIVQEQMAQAEGTAPSPFAQRLGAGDIKLFRFSNATSGVRGVLDPADPTQRNGQEGAERRRRQSYGTAFPNRLYYYMAGSPVESQFEGMPNLFEATVPVSSLYDLATDPEGIVRFVVQENGGFDATRAEQLIRDADYVGYYNSEGGPGQQGIVTVFKSLPVSSAPATSIFDSVRGIVGAVLDGVGKIGKNSANSLFGGFGQVLEYLSEDPSMQRHIRDLVRQLGGPSLGISKKLQERGIPSVAADIIQEAVNAGGPVEIADIDVDIAAQSLVEALPQTTPTELDRKGNPTKRKGGKPKTNYTLGDARMSQRQYAELPLEDRTRHVRRLVSKARDAGELSRLLRKWNPLFLGAEGRDAVLAEARKKISRNEKELLRTVERLATAKAAIPEAIRLGLTEDQLKKLSPQGQEQVFEQNLQATEPAGGTGWNPTPETSRESFTRARRAIQWMVSIAASPEVALGDRTQLGDLDDFLDKTLAAAEAGAPRSAFHALEHAIRSLEKEQGIIATALQKLGKRLATDPRLDRLFWDVLDGSVEGADGRKLQDPLLALPEGDLREAAAQLRGLLDGLISRQEDVVQARFDREIFTMEQHLQELKEGGRPRGRNERQLPFTRASLEKQIATLKKRKENLQLRRDNYITWLHNAHAETMFETNGVMSGLLANPTIWNQFLESRRSAAPFTRSTLLSLQAYVPYALRVIHLEPGIVQAMKMVEKTGDVHQKEYLRQLIDRLKGVPTWTDRHLSNLMKVAHEQGLMPPPGARPGTELIGALNRRIYAGYIDFINTALLNLTQQVLGTIELAAQNPARVTKRLFGRDVSVLSDLEKIARVPEVILSMGIGDMQALWLSMKKGYSQLTGQGKLFTELEEADLLGEMNRLFDDTLVESMERTLGVRSGRSRAGRIIRAVDDALLSSMRFTEIINRGAVYFAAKRMALSRGSSNKEAMAFGSEMANKTQFRFGALGEAPALQTTGGKMVRPFTTFPRKTLELVVADTIMPLTRDGNIYSGPGAAQRVRLLLMATAVGAFSTMSVAAGDKLEDALERFFFGMLPAGVTPFLGFMVHLFQAPTNPASRKKVLTFMQRVTPGFQRTFTEDRGFLGGASLQDVAAAAGAGAAQALTSPGPVPKLPPPNVRPRSQATSPGSNQLPVENPTVRRNLETLANR